MERNKTEPNGTKERNTEHNRQNGGQYCPQVGKYSIERRKGGGMKK